MKKQPSIDWIFFDVGGVLTGDTEREKYRIRAIFESVSKFLPNITEKEIYNIRDEASKLPGYLTENMISLLLQNEDEKNIAKKRLSEYWKTKPAPPSPIRTNAGLVLQELSKNYSIGIIANQPSFTQEKLENAGIAKYFKKIALSEDYNLRKPNPKFFNKILAECEADPKKSTMIDDNLERALVPAKNLRMTTILYNPNNIKINHKSVDFQISSLEELLEIFR